MEERIKGLEEELSQYKRRANEYFMKFEETRDEYEEFRSNSKELELELEMQLNQADQAYSKLSDINKSLKLELESMRRQVEQQSTDINRLQEENSLQRQTLERQLIGMRQLEQINDDLERAKRQALSSIQDFEVRLNDAIEKNVFLQGEKDDLLDCVQRLKDESRDLNHELHVRRVIHTSASSKSNDLILSQNIPVNGVISESCQTSFITVNDEPIQQPVADLSPHQQLKTSSPKSFDDHELSVSIPMVSTHPVPHVSQSPFVSDSKRSHAMPSNGGDAMSTSLRVTALNSVNDLMRKVGALEYRLTLMMQTNTTFPNAGNKSSFLPHSIPESPNIIDYRSNRMTTSMYAMPHS